MGARLERQHHREGRSDAGLALNDDRTAVRLGELARDEQTEAEPAEMTQRHGALEPAEDPAQRLLLDADAVVRDRDPDRPVAVLGLDLDRLALAVLDGVGEEVREDLLDAEPVPAAGDRLAGVADELGTDLARLGAEALDHVPHDRGEIERLDLERDPAGGDARHVEETLDEASQAGDLVRGVLELLREAVVLDAGPVERAAQGVELELQRGQRRLELVGGDLEKLVTRPHGLPELVLGALERGDVLEAGGPEQ